MGKATKSYRDTHWTLQKLEDVTSATWSFFAPTLLNIVVNMQLVGIAI